MIQNKKIQFLFKKEKNIEVVICSNSKLSYPLHNHISVFVIGIVLSGSIRVVMNKSPYFYSKNQVFLITPYTPHKIQADENYALLSLCIYKNFINDICINDMKRSIYELLCFYKIGQNEVIQILSYVDFIAHNRNTDIFIKKIYINKLKNEIELFPEKKLSIEKMSQAVFISKYHLIREFKNTVGLTPHQFQIQNRIHKAKQILYENERVTEAALDTGFYDQSHFIRHFKKIVGLTPLEYKLSCKII